MENKHKTLSALFMDIADAIREKNVGALVADNFPEEIRKIETGVQLPTLANPGTAADLAAGKELIDGEGNVVVGTGPIFVLQSLFGGSINLPTSVAQKNNIFLCAIKLSSESGIVFMSLENGLPTRIIGEDMGSFYSESLKKPYDPSTGTITFNKSISARFDGDYWIFGY